MIFVVSLSLMINNDIKLSASAIFDTMDNLFMQLLLYKINVP